MQWRAERCNGPCEKTVRIDRYNDARFPKPAKESKIGSWKTCLQQLQTENREQEPDVHEDEEKQEGPSSPGLHSILLERLDRKKSFSGSPRSSNRSSTDVSPRPRNCVSLDMSPGVPLCNELASPNGAVFPALHHRASIGPVSSSRPSSVVSPFGGPQQHFSTASSSSLQGASTMPSSVVSTSLFKGQEGNDGLTSSRSSTPWERLADPGRNLGSPRSNLGTPRTGRLGRQSTQTETTKQRPKSLELMTSIDSAAEVASQLLARHHDAATEEQRSSQSSDSSSMLDGQNPPPAAPLQPRPSSLRPPGMAGCALAGAGTDPGSQDTTQAFANAFLNAAPTQQRTAAVPDSRAGQPPRPPTLPPKSPTAFDPTSNRQAHAARHVVPPLALPGKLPAIHLNNSLHSSGSSSSISAWRSSSTPRLRGTRLQGHPTPLMPALDLSSLCTPRQRAAEGGGQGDGVQGFGGKAEDRGKGVTMQRQEGASKTEGGDGALGEGHVLGQTKSRGDRFLGDSQRLSLGGRRSLSRASASLEREEQGLLGGTAIKLQPRISQQA